jgi:hypothetical protein
VNSWIRQNRVANNIYMRWEHSVGVIVMNPEEILKHFETGFRQGGRLLRRRIRRVDWVPRERLNEIGQARFDHDARVVDAVDRALRQGAKQIAIELAPVKSLPKPILPSPDLSDKK